MTLTCLSLPSQWSKVQSAKFSVLEHQMDPTSNFSSYRSTLKAAMWRSAGAVDDRQKIVIPFFSLLVKDLYFLNEGCASRCVLGRLPNGHINFDKFWQLAKQVTEFMAWKQVTCPFERAPDVINHLHTAHMLSETGLALASFECEGPDNSYEKERYKTLNPAQGARFERRWVFQESQRLTTRQSITRNKKASRKKCKSDRTGITFVISLKAC
ncbi:Ras-GEF domain-containing family member 1B [Portunus trituberculatus]|uniref:Ras-GEF domain-containing family member 1B n=1 Tax=Portunus trituberculatus TaxID=210409 RepID=A0A5B7GNC5_PORTR|nr:Ras-GEF domain-containing family member 1B [Portunus trituberculatus]